MINSRSNLEGSVSGLNSLLRPSADRGGSARAGRLAPQVLDNGGRTVASTQFDVGKAGALLNEKLASSLGKALEIGGPQIDSGGDFSPEKVGQRILSFIDSAIASARANGADPAALEKKWADAKSGVEKGFAEAQDILQSFGAWNGSIQTNAEKTLDLIQQGFAERTAADAPPTPASSGTQLLRTDVAAFDARNAQTFEMEIKTREGDIVKLSYSADQSAGFAARRTANEKNGSAEEFFAYSSQSENLSFSVQGDLNADEQKAISALMQDVDTLAGDFYGGDMQGALRHAMALGMDGEQLSSLSLDMSRSQSRSAIAAYEQVGAPEQKQNAAPLNKSEIGAIGDFNQQLTQTLRDAGKFFQDADQMVSQLFQDLAPATPADAFQGLATGSLRDLLDGLIAAAAAAVNRDVPAQAIVTE